LVFHKQFALGGRLAARSLLEIGLAALAELPVERFERIDLRHWHQEAASSEAQETLDV